MSKTGRPRERKISGCRGLEGEEEGATAIATGVGVVWADGNVWNEVM